MMPTKINTTNNNNTTNTNNAPLVFVIYALYPFPPSLIGIRGAPESFVWEPHIAW